MYDCACNIVNKHTMLMKAPYLFILLRAAFRGRRNRARDVHIYTVYFLYVQIIPLLRFVSPS